MWESRRLTSVWDFMGEKSVNIMVMGGTRKRTWFRRYGTSRLVGGSIPDKVIDFFLSSPNHSSRTRPWGLLSL
jgi:hypothetical protein